MAKLYFSRFHLITGRDPSEKLQFILEGLKNDISISIRGFIYRFLNCETIDFEGKRFITGELVKYEPESSQDIVDDETMTIVSERFRNKVVATTKYVLDPSSSILMHIDVPNLIDINVFRKSFSSLFIKNHDGFFMEFSLSPIMDEYSFIEEIKTFTAIKKISITLYPSNPNSADKWVEFDKRLQRNEIEVYKEIQETRRPDGNINIDKETESKFFMSEDGYGECNALGITKNGEEKIISTKDASRNVNVKLPNDEINDIMKVIASGFDTLNEIIKRTL